MFHRSFIPLFAALALAACASEPEPVPAPPPPPADPGPEPETMGGMCGGYAGFQCQDENAYCKYAPEDFRIADKAGICTEEPDICTAEYAPVCGDDDESYGNPCNAAMEGVSVQHEGLCEGDRGTTAR